MSTDQQGGLAGGLSPPSDLSNWLVCPQTWKALTSLDAHLRRVVQPADPQLGQVARYLVLRGGKRVRPALLFLAATFGQFVHSRLLTAGTALELIHVASLHHDDVIDRAPLRRNGASANAQWGNQVAALAGNYLFARATSLLASLGETANQLAAVGIANLCAGQLQEVENTFNLELDEQQHFEILRRKTATLFTLPCHLGCRLAGVSTIQTTALLTYARELGIAFQLADDTLDFIGSAERLGKATGRDLREGVYSLPVLLALHSSGQVAEELNALLAQYTLTEADTIKAIRLVRESGAVHQSLGVAREHAGRALAALSGLPNSLARRSLERLAEYVVLRSS